jgi:hypothetical protein
MDNRDSNRLQRGRGATFSPDNRYSAHTQEALDDGWGSLDAPLEPLRTTFTIDSSRTVISYNDSPDVGFDRSINPYRGCEHGCVYCFARPSHAWLGLSPGLDFESRLFYKPDAPDSETSWPRAPIGRRRSRSASTPMRISRANENSKSRAASSNCWSSADTRSAS